jgi:hypothetical protein
VVFRVTNNVITSFTLNLPHVIVTFIEKQTFFDARVAMTAFVTIIIDNSCCIDNLDRKKM